LSTDKVVTLIAFGTVSIGGVGFALISNRNASAIGVHEPVVRADKADLVVPIPGSTSEVGRSGVVGGREDTSSIDEVVSLET
jgi:hypothetical protein